MDKHAFIKHFCEKRAGCKESTGKTNFYNIRRLRKMSGNSEKVPKSSKWVTKKLLESMKTLTPTVKKNLSASLVAYLRTVKTPESLLQSARELMKHSTRKVEKIYEMQQKTPKDKANWLTTKQISDFTKEAVRRTADMELYKKQDWLPRERRIATDALLLLLHHTNPPRLEYAELWYTTQRTPPSKEHNWLMKLPKTGWATVIYSGKTARGQVIKLSPPVVRYLNKHQAFLKDNRPVFTNRKGEQLSRNAYGKRLRGLYARRFGKNITASRLRSIFVTEKYKNMPSFDDMQNTSHAMMHDIKTALTRYVRK